MSQDLAGRYELRYAPGESQVLVLLDGRWRVVHLAPSEVNMLARILEEATHG